MTRAEANQVDLVEYLFSLGFIPAEIRGDDYWYLSPFRNDKEASFKVNTAKNAWYDHGAGKDGDVIDLITSYFNCDVSTASQELSSLNHISHRQSGLAQTSDPAILSETIQPDLSDKQAALKQRLEKAKDTTNQHEGRPPFHLHENRLINHRDAAETAVQIIAAKKLIAEPILCRYLSQRRIAFKFSNKDIKHTLIGFKNSAGGYELRNPFFLSQQLTQSMLLISAQVNNILIQKQK